MLIEVFLHYAAILLYFMLYICIYFLASFCRFLYVNKSSLYKKTRSKALEASNNNRTQNSELRNLFNIIQLCYCSLGYIRYKRKVDNALEALLFCLFYRLFKDYMRHHTVQGVLYLLQTYCFIQHRSKY